VAPTPERANQPPHRVHVLHHPRVAEDFEITSVSTLRPRRNLGDAERLADATAETPAIRLLHSLGDLPAADRAYVDDVGAHDGQRRPRFLEVARVTHPP